MVRTGYKRTEVGEIPEDWEAQPCAALSRLITVGIVVRPSQYYATTGVPALRSANIREAGIDYSDMAFISEAANRLLAKSQLRSGDIVSVRTGYPGTSAVVPACLEGANCIDILITRPREIVNSAFLAAWINSPYGKTQVLRTQGGLAQQHFNVGELRALVVALPGATAEQDAIAGALTDADSLIESLEQLLAKKRAIKQGAMQLLLTGAKRLPGFTGSWEQKNLGSIGRFLKGSGVTRDQANSGHLPCVRYGEIYTQHTDVVRCFHSRITREVAVHALRLQQGDLLFAGSGETKEEIGKCVAFVHDVEAYAGGDIVVLRPTWGNSTFLGYFLNTGPVVRQKARRGQGDAVVHISSRALAEVTCTFPQPDEQAAIAEVLADLDADIDATAAKLQKARDLRQGMMEELLTGRIRLV